MPIALSGGASRTFRLGAGALTLLALTAPEAVGQSFPIPAGATSVPAAAYQQRSFIDAEFLRMQLQSARELDFSDARPESRGALILEVQNKLADLKEKAAKGPATNDDAKKGPAFDPTLILASQARNWAALGLAAQKDKDCQRTRAEADRLVSMATELRVAGVLTVPGRAGQVAAPRVQSLNEFLSNRFRRVPSDNLADLVPALVQTMQAEEEPSRSLLADLLNLSDSPAATAALAHRTLYDLSPTVRAKALQALRNRPPEAVRKILLEGLHYPWAVVADHAAEALVGLGDRAAVPDLKRLAAEPDPGLPIVRPGTGKNNVVREVVRINHLRNCVLCHAPAPEALTAFVAPVPTPGKELPVGYYGSRSTGDLMVRADITYLRQDFSLVQPVADAKPWPEMQRFDFLVREREATLEELDWLKNPPATYPQREAVLWALKELSR